MKTLTSQDIENIRQNPNKQNWYSLSADYILPENFIKEFQDYVDWYWISVHQNLSENFTREFQDKVSWYCVIAHQKLSEEFFLEFKSKLFNKNYYTRCCIYKNYHNIKYFLKYGMKFNNELKGYLMS